jgi:murein L,D-transpeptidase YafK
MAQIGVPSSERSRNAITRVKPSLEAELAKKDLSYGAPIFIRIFKQPEEFEVWLQKEGEFHLFKTYQICTYGNGDLGPKLKQGDGQAPEGFYSVTPKRMNPSSKFHLSFDLGYPNDYDRALKRTGSALMVHGDCVSIGCYAMTDPFIEEIYALADAAFRNGKKYFDVHIFPFRMTKENMEKYSDSKWISFWQNLEEGYNLFETNRKPPIVHVKGYRYSFK